jgi:hypothetical protein
MNNVKLFFLKKRGNMVKAFRQCSIKRSPEQRANAERMSSYLSSWYLPGVNIDELTHCCFWKISLLRIEAAPRVRKGIGLMIVGYRRHTSLLSTRTCRAST